MNRRVRQKREYCRGKDQTNISSKTPKCGCLSSATISGVDWTTLPDDTVIQLFSYLHYRDRASLASTCQTFRLLGSSPCLWGSLDLRSHKFDTAAAVSLSPRCKNLQRLKFHAAGSTDAIVSLQARKLREISGDLCRDITDAALSVIAARHEMLESVHLGPDACERISCDAIKALAYCCPRLQRLWMSGVKDINGDAINALAKHCRQLKDVGFVESDNIDEVALGNLNSVKFLSVAGTRNLKWGSVAHVWSRLPSLICLDVSRTDINLSAVTGFLSSSQNLKVLSALNCPVFEGEVDSISMYNHKGKILLTFLSDMFKGVTSLFADSSKNVTDVFQYWRRLVNRDKNVDEIVVWIECVFSQSLLRIAENNLKEFDDFWLSQGAAVLLSLLQSSQEEVQERAATAVATFVVIDDENATVDCKRAEAILRGDGIRVLLNLARSCQEGLQSEAAKAIANLSIDSKVAKAVAGSGGINILANLAKSMNRLVAEEAAGGLWNLSVGDDHKGAIAKAGGIKALVDLIFKWPSSSEGLLERATGALANLGADEKCSLEVAVAGGIHALVMLARNCKFDGVQEQPTSTMTTASSSDGISEVLSSSPHPVLVETTSASITCHWLNGDNYIPCENTMVMSWLINSMTPEVGENFLLYETTTRIWRVAKATYSNLENSTVLFGIECQLTNLKKERRPLCDYCKKVGHVRDTCWRLHSKPNDGKSSKKHQQRDAQGNISRATLAHKSDTPIWIVDSRTSDHMTCDLRLFQSFNGNSSIS
ncbi:Protein ARABIDILLO 1 [Hibiscus syriacus]|uniref:Protein ARABIDILLO 1 n=1 Tax=Hibiscus syriacus TaxID=106335 RepID=A0A6A3AMI1_HIBSY|nr:Protein ARABIDILLO 1 [Hibiscus syriacus]